MTMEEHEKEEKTQVSFIHRSFMNNTTNKRNLGKLRCRERYSRHRILSSSSLESIPTHSLLTTPSLEVFILPDAMFLRKYLKFWEELVVILRAHNKQNDNARSDSDGNKNKNEMRYTLILLESVAEAMDARSGSGIENPNMNERDRVCRLVNRSIVSESENNDVIMEGDSTVKVFCDLSYREVTHEFDKSEFEEMMEMAILLRSKYALHRASRLLSNLYNGKRRQRQQQSSSFIVLSSEEEDTINYPSQNNNNVKVLSTIDEFLNHLFDEYNSVVTQEEYHHLVEMITSCNLIYEERNNPSLLNLTDENDEENTPPSEEEISSRVLSDIENETSTILKGILEIPKKSRKEPYVSCNTSFNQQKYFITGEIRAFPGDTVVIQVLPKSQWKGVPISTRKLVFHSSDDDGDDDPNKKEKDNDLDQINRQNIHDLEGDSNNKVPTAKILKIAKETGRRKIVATHVVYKASSSPNTQNTILVTPMDIRYPKIRVSSKYGHSKNRMLIQIDDDSNDWRTDSSNKYPNGHFIKDLGPIGDFHTEMNCLLYEHELYDDFRVPFSLSALSCLPASPEIIIPSNEVNCRRDLRNIPGLYIYSVDPPGCQDIDDCMSARMISATELEVGVHIADVSYYVKQGSALDLEALRKSTTFYLTHDRYDMLPSLLSSNLCSLHGGKDRFAVSVLWILERDGETGEWGHVPKSTWVGRTIIHNCQAMTYDQAHNILHSLSPDDKEKDIPPLTAGAPVSPKLIPDLYKSLSFLTDISIARQSVREEHGGALSTDLSSASAELKFDFTLSSGGELEIHQVKPKKDLQIHHTIAELMIWANSTVAERIHSYFPQISLLRIHDTVEKDTQELETVIQKASTSGSTHQTTTNKKFNLALSLKQFKEATTQINNKKEKKQSSNSSNKYDENGKLVSTYVQSLAVRVLSEAKYVCTGGPIPKNEWRHFGLGIDFYTHFTSPIRRYADIIVHRLLLESIQMDANNGSVKEKTKMNTTNSNRGVAIPESSAISILRGGGLVESVGHRYNAEMDKSDFLDTLMNTTETAKITSTTINPPIIHHAPTIMLYTTKEINDICERINHQNRKSKILGQECQTLFLSLYFQKNSIVTSAVIIGLRQNGLLVYVPKFNFRGPVFLTTADDNESREELVLDPRFIGLTMKDGDPYSKNEGGNADESQVVVPYRRFPGGKCVLKNSNDDDDRTSSYLSIEGIHNAKRQCKLHLLDVVTVQLSSYDNNNESSMKNTHARVSLPRIHLIFKASQKMNSTSKHLKTAMTEGESSKNQQKYVEGEETKEDSLGQPQLPQKIHRDNHHQKEGERVPSVYEIIHSIEIVPNIPPTNNRKKKEQKTQRQQTMPGRFVFNSSFLINHHDSERETQSNITSAQKVDYSSYDTSKNIERDITARIQRKAAEKRNTRRSAAHKR